MTNAQSTCRPIDGQFNSIQLFFANFQQFNSAVWHVFSSLFSTWSFLVHCFFRFFFVGWLFNIWLMSDLFAHCWRYRLGGRKPISISWYWIRTPPTSPYSLSPNMAGSVYIWLTLVGLPTDKRTKSIHKFCVPCVCLILLNYSLAAVIVFFIILLSYCIFYHLFLVFISGIGCLVFDCLVPFWMTPELMIITENIFFGFVFPNNK